MRQSVGVQIALLTMLSILIIIICSNAPNAIYVNRCKMLMKKVEAVEIQLAYDLFIWLKWDEEMKVDWLLMHCVKVSDSTKTRSLILSYYDIKTLFWTLWNEMKWPIYVKLKKFAKKEKINETDGKKKIKKQKTHSSFKLHRKTKLIITRNKQKTKSKQYYLLYNK